MTVILLSLNPRKLLLRSFSLSAILSFQFSSRFIVAIFNLVKHFISITCLLRGTTLFPSWLRAERSRTRYSYIESGKKFFHLLMVHMLNFSTYKYGRIT